MDLKKTLEDAGYKVVEGADAVRDAIGFDFTNPLCSGYKVFPDGRKCPGCADCQPSEGDR